MNNEKIKKTVLYGHTGSNNRGCEAIVRSTVKLLKNEGFITDIATYRAEEDIRAGIDTLGDLIEYRSYDGKQSLIRIANGLLKKIFHYEYPYESYVQKDIFCAVKRSGSAVVIGGDTYCYGRNSCVSSYNLLKYIKKINAKAFLWSCSIGIEDLDKEKISYLKQYDMIFPRERLTYDNLISVGVPKENLCLMSDSAFILDTKKVALPDGFTNVFAYNPSYTLGVKENRDQLLRSRVTVLNYILNHTDMNVALIPHVYSQNQGDALWAKEIAQQLNHRERVFLFEREYTCEELKYIISKCRMLVAERTHASIAGYSQLIPTFVIGYSVKSIGIAKDIFGTDDGFVVSYKDIVNDNDLIEPIKDFVSREEEIRQQLERVIPAYKRKAIIGAERLAEFLE